MCSISKTTSIPPDLLNMTKHDQKSPNSTENHQNQPEITKLYQISTNLQNRKLYVKITVNE